MNLKAKFGVVLVLFLFSSCGNFEDISIDKPKNVEVLGFEDNYLKLNVDLPVKNPTIHNIRIVNMDVKVFLNEKYIGKMLVDTDVVIKRKSERIYKLPIKVRLNNLLGAAYIMMNLKDGQKINVRFEGELSAKSMFVKKTVDFNKTQQITI